MADCSSGGYQPPVTHDHRQWKARYVGRGAAEMTTNGDSNDWNQQHAECSRTDTWCQDNKLSTFVRTFTFTLPVLLQLVIVYHQMVVLMCS